MLLSLYIKDFVIVDSLNLEFAAGFTVLTGETGAGKSIIIDAISLLLGDRADGNLVREQASFAELSAMFNIEKQKQAKAWLIENALTEENSELLLRRVIDKNGRSRNFINGHPCTLTQLKTLGEYLVDIHGQHAHQSLSKPDNQRQLLDAYSASTVLAAEVKQAYQTWQAAQKNLQEATAIAKNTQNERERLIWQINELTELDLLNNEWEELNQQHSRLANSAELLQKSQQAQNILSDDEVSCLGLLTHAQQKLIKVATIDQKLNDVLCSLNSVKAELSEAAHTLRAYTSDLESDPQSLADAESRLAAIMSMARKYQSQPENLSKKLSEWQQQLTMLDAANDIDSLKTTSQIALANYQHLAHKLTQKRQKTATEISLLITQQMQTLAMNGARFAVVLNAENQPRAHGMENIEFQVAANAGSSLRTLAKVASGGELSRISLAMQVVISQIADVPTLIFDEVDSGIGGAVAEIVGKLLKKLGENYQVLAITHLAQVASCGNKHWQVSKKTQHNKTISKIKQLEQNQRIEEIARMLGGLKITEATLQHAKEMIEVNSQRQS